MMQRKPFPNRWRGKKKWGASQNSVQKVSAFQKKKENPNGVLSSLPTANENGQQCPHKGRETISDDESFWWLLLQWPTLKKHQEGGDNRHTKPEPVQQQQVRSNQTRRRHNCKRKTQQSVLHFERRFHNQGCYYTSSSDNWTPLDNLSWNQAMFYKAYATN